MYKFQILEYFLFYPVSIILGGKTVDLVFSMKKLYSLQFI